MLISIIIPIYNVAPYVEQCLQSVASQTYQGEMECLLVDDCGTDNSIDICERFISSYNGSISFRILHHEHNRGLSAARNTGIKEAKGNYLYLLDSDDSITPGCIESMHRMVERFPGVECVFAGANVIGEGYEWMSYIDKNLPEYSTDRDWIQEGMLKRFLFSMTAWNRLVSNSYIKKNNIYFVEGLINEDELWNLEISQSVRTAAFLKENTYNYFLRNNSIITSANHNNRLLLERRFRVVDKMLDNIKGYRKGIQSYYIMLFVEDILPHISTFCDYSNLLKVMVKAIIKADCSHARMLLHLSNGWNRYFVLKLVGKL